MDVLPAKRTWLPKPPLFGSSGAAVMQDLWLVGRSSLFLLFFFIFYLRHMRGTCAFGPYFYSGNSVVIADYRVVHGGVNDCGDSLC